MPLDRPTQQDSSVKHVPALDGLRGCALLMVFYFHTCASPALPRHWRLLSSYGWTGVDLFFVLSGYLITNILLNSRDNKHYYRTFYGRRVLRIAPVYYAGLVIILLIQPVIYHYMHPHDPVVHYAWRQQILYWLNLSNLRSAFFPLEVGLGSLYWSLAIEEQFYAIWPSVVHRARDRTVAIICVVGMATTICLRCLPVVQNYNHIYSNFIYRFTPFRLDGLLAGSLLAVFLQARPSASARHYATLGTFSIGVLLFLVSFSGLINPRFEMSSKLGYTATAFLAASAVGVCVAPTGKVGKQIGRLFSFSLLRSFGKYSYFLYVFQALILYLVGHPLEKLTRSLHLVAATYVSALLALGFSYVLAAISWKFMEQPLLRLKRLFPYRPAHPSPTL